MVEVKMENQIRSSKAQKGRGEAITKYNIFNKCKYFNNPNECFYIEESSNVHLFFYCNNYFFVHIIKKM